MKENITIQELTGKVEKASTDFEISNTDLKRKYILWNIEVFNILAKHVSVSKGTFGTGYPFYVLDNNLQGTLPIIPEQIRYNMQLVKDGKPFQKSIWLCKSCLEEKYSSMPDLKKICKPCPNVPKELKPRKIINRLPDIDMWLVCDDGSIEQAQTELTELFRQYDLHSSDINPIRSIDEVSYITEMVSKGVFPKMLLPIDAHIIEYSSLSELITEVPLELEKAVKDGITPYLPINPKSYRKDWQYDDEAYNFVFDYLASLTPFNFNSELAKNLDDSRIKVVSLFSTEELFDLLMNAATGAAFRRFHTPEVKKQFFNRMSNWESMKFKNCNIQENDEKVAK